MGITAQEESGNVFIVRISGLLKKAEWDAAQAAAAQKWESADDIKLLIMVDDFKGWERDKGWGDMSFYEKFREKITRIAIVGDPKHESDLMMFSGAGFRPAPVKYFLPNQLESARKWLVS
jgi:hypothetical protein